MRSSPRRACTFRHSTSPTSRTSPRSSRGSSATTPPRSVDQQRGRHGPAREQNGAGFRASNRGQSPRPLCPRDAADRCLSSTPEARVVTVSSLAHRQGKISFDDLHWQKRGYSASFAYGQSKLANLLFTQELQRRFDEAGVKVRAVAAHPGWTVTNLQQHSFLFRMLNPIFGMRPPQGALPPSSRQPHPTRRTAATTAPTAFSSCVATRRKRRNPRRPRTLRTLPACGKSRSNSRVLNSQSAKPHRAWRANDGALVRP